MIKKVKLIAGTFVLSTMVLIANKVSAVTCITPNNPPGCTSGSIDTKELAVGNLNTYISDALGFAIWAAGLLSVVFIIIGGFQYITAGASKDGATKAKNTLTYAIIGLVIVLLALVIRNYVLTSIGVSIPVL
ncbi:MAG: hypothetical protein PHU42_00790 [Patescibacteria group bacterium]|nr:hypothetical protein [Patescibacteria group bacterium]